MTAAAPATDGQETSQPHKVAYLTGIRGWAASGVMTLHVVGIFVGSSLPSVAMDFLLLGKYGVIVFFVLSAYTITLSLEGRRFDLRNYLARRFLRIAPAYYFLLLIALPLNGSSWAGYFLTYYTFESFLFHLTFFNWIDYRHTNNALGVEWTLSIEFFYYLLLPAIIFLSRSWQGCAALSLLAVSIFALPRPTPVEAWLWSPWPFAICFAVGVIAFRFREEAHKLRFFSSGAATWVAIIIALAVGTGLELEFEWSVILWTVTSATLILCGGSRTTKLLFENKLAVGVGEISYPLYLVHLPVLVFVDRYADGWPAALITFVASFLMAIAIHKWIEKPVHQFAKRQFGQERLLKHNRATQHSDALGG